MSEFNFPASGYQRGIQENFTIVDKGIPGQRGPAEVPFLLNKAQEHFLYNLGRRNVILKARKLGFSSLMLAVACLRFLTKENERCYIMSFDASAASKQLERAKHFLRSYGRINKVDILKQSKYNSKTELVLEIAKPDGSSYTNVLRVGTAKSSGFGRGDDITFLHLTEVSMADNIEELIAGVGEAVVHDAIITMETTANGHNAFKTFWDEAASGARGYKTFFYGPEWEYDEEFLARKREELGRLYDQEFPSSAEIAFLTSGSVFFDAEALRKYLNKTVEPLEVIRV